MHRKADEGGIAGFYLDRGEPREAPGAAGPDELPGVTTSVLRQEFVVDIG